MRQRRRAFSTNWGDSGGVVSTRWSKGENFGICGWLSRQHGGNSPERGPVDMHYFGWFRKYGKKTPQDKKGQLIRVARFCKCHQAEVRNIPIDCKCEYFPERSSWRWDCESIIEAMTTWCNKIYLEWKHRFYKQMALHTLPVLHSECTGLIIFHAMRSVGLD